MAKKFDPKAKAKRQKIIAAVLGVLLLGVIAYEVPSLMKSMNKKPPAVTAPGPVAGTPIAGGPVTTQPLPAPVAARLLPIQIHRPRPGVGSSCRSTGSRARTRSFSRWMPRSATPTPRRPMRRRV